MDSSNEEVLLFSVKLSSGANQKRKRRECEKYLKKKTEQGVSYSLLQKIRVNDRESHFR